MAVRFCFIRYIEEIKVSLDAEEPVEEKHVIMSKDGVLVLNKDSKIYPTLRRVLPKLMKKPHRSLVKELERCKRQQKMQLDDYVYHAAVVIEIHRREECKGAKKWLQLERLSNFWTM